MKHTDILENNEISEEYSIWTSKDKTFIFPELKTGKKLKALQTVGDNAFRIDFELIEAEGFIAFHDLYSGLKYIFDITDLDLGKINFIDQSGMREIWTRKPIGKTKDL